ncbi:hypothetical protein D5086_000489 [Populus alba]|uniref:Uncharacterized protein n=1 Tax=Populus alba TaxID=43335 RepID=A0ACC4CWQ6_POPAL
MLGIPTDDVLIIAHRRALPSASKFNICSLGIHLERLCRRGMLGIPTGDVLIIAHRRGGWFEGGVLSIVGCINLSACLLLANLTYVLLGSILRGCAERDVWKFRAVMIERRSKTVKKTKKITTQKNNFTSKYLLDLGGWFEGGELSIVGCINLGLPSASKFNICSLGIHLERLCRRGMLGIPTGDVLIIAHRREGKHTDTIFNVVRQIAYIHHSLAMIERRSKTVKKTKKITKQKTTLLPNIFLIWEGGFEGGELSIVGCINLSACLSPRKFNICSLGIHLERLCRRGMLGIPSGDVLIIAHMRD